MGLTSTRNQHGVSSTDNIDFIHKHEVPQLYYRPSKGEPYRVRITARGNRLSYDEDAGSPAANLLETKVLLNSTISDAEKGACFMIADIKDYFLATPMAQSECTKLKIKHIPEDICKQYNLYDRVTHDGYIYIKIKKGMYRLKQVAILAYNILQSNLKPSGYQPAIDIVGL